MSDANTTLRPESPLNVIVSKDIQDPIMTQIAEDAMGYAKDLSFKPPRRHVDYAAGAIRQDQIAWNRCLDEVILSLSLRVDGLMMSWKTSRAEELIKFKEEVLEKLRR